MDVSARGGNWGKKLTKGARWVRRGKIAAWGPGMDDWEVYPFFHCLSKSIDRTPGRGTGTKKSEITPLA